MLKIEDINALNIEVSSACTAACRFCSRMQKAREYGQYRLGLDDFRRLPIDFMSRLRRVSFDGDFGDLCANDEFPAIVEYLSSLNPGLPICGHTNGSAQSQDWWAALGPYFKNGDMVFGLDGLGDTHSLHRRGTDFNRVVENMAAFISAGGRAQWQFIVFRHNEHQIEAAKDMARDLGCTRFFVLYSRDYNQDLREPKSLNAQLKRDAFKNVLKSLPAEDRKALCKPLAKGSVYIAADGTVHPCCLAHCMYVTEHNKMFAFAAELIARYKDQINFKTRPIDEIIAGPYFEEMMAKALKNPYCIMKCNPHRKAALEETVVLNEQLY
jgi:MoaA/NifB/PqqE/SkfB family radical SAM enzyme